VRKFGPESSSTGRGKEVQGRSKKVQDGSRCLKCCCDCLTWLVMLVYGAAGGFTCVYVQWTMYYTTGWFRGSILRFLLAILTSSLLVLLHGLCWGLYKAAMEKHEDTQQETQICSRLPKGVRMHFWKGRCFYAFLVIGFAVLEQTKTVLLSPGESLLPIEWTATSASPINGTLDCSFHSHWTMAQSFFADSSVQFSKVLLIIPKVANPYAPGAAASADESNIYLYQEACEVSSRIFVHELVHVWQFQTLSIFQRASVDQLIMWPWSCRTWECVYDFGGEAGLQKVLSANPHAQITAAFSVEQQAEIVETYYEYWRTPWLRRHNNSYHQLLRHFALQVLSK